MRVITFILTIVSMINLPDFSQDHFTNIQFEAIFWFIILFFFIIIIKSNVEYFVHTYSDKQTPNNKNKIIEKINHFYDQSLITQIIVAIISSLLQEVYRIPIFIFLSLIITWTLKRLTKLNDI